MERHIPKSSWTFAVRNRRRIERESTKLIIRKIIKPGMNNYEKVLVNISGFNCSTYNIERLITKVAEKSRLREEISVRRMLDEALGIVEIKFVY